MPAKAGLFVFAADWRSEPTLALVSEGARLLWWEMLMLMSEAEPYGHLIVGGKSPTPAQLAVLTRTDPERVDSRLAELEEAGTFSRTRTGVIHSRRMVRDSANAAKSRENGKLGGNPSLRKHGTNGGPDNPPTADRDKPRARVPNLTLPNQD